MGVTHFEERCPHCRRLLYIDNVERGISFGNTISTCFHCNQTYLDNKVYEWVNLNYEQKKAVLVAGPEMTIVTEAETKNALQKYGFTKYLLIGIPAVKQLEKQLDMYKNFVFKPEMLLQKHIQDSIKRTSDPEYLQTLLKMGRNYYGDKFE